MLEKNESFKDDTNQSSDEILARQTVRCSPSLQLCHDDTAESKKPTFVWSMAHMKVKHAMPALFLPIHEENPHTRNIRMAADALDKGGVVLLPTETGYCLVGDAKLESTHRTFLSLRQAHPNKKPFSLLCRDLQQTGQCAVLTTSVYRIATRAFPGPFTFILETNRHTPKFAGTPKRKSVGIRISSHLVAQAVIDAFGSPLLITSITDAEELELTDYFDDEQQRDAWWTDAEAIAARFRDGIQVVLASSRPVPMRVSTVIDFTQDPAIVLRDGGWGTDIIGIIS
jgi:tRNA threonylcarbamoyl adenosine modification protein (Sua5/YciO/YrdC/YwlC family)